MKISNGAVTSKQNVTEKYHRLMKMFNGYSQTQVIFFLFTQTHLKTALKTKTFEKIYFIRFY